MSISLASRIAHAAAILLLASATVLGAIGLAAPAQAVGEPAFTNPLVEDAADPTIEYYQGNYYMVATTWDNRVVMRKSPSLAALAASKPVTVYTDTNPGRNANMWAPELQRLEGPNGPRWYLMYTMGTAGSFGAQHLQVIESAADDPMGPYTYKGRPIPTDEWNIDGAYLELGGELFVTWSQFAPDGLQSNYIARMTNPWTAAGPLNILSQPVEEWERIGMPVNEGPIPLQRDGRTWIVYSASFCGTEDYQLGTLEYKGGDPVLAASWVKSDGPVFSKGGGVFGPGHNDFFESPDGTEIWNLYHGNARPDGGCARERSARAQIVEFAADGEPEFGSPQVGVPVGVPSGENGPITAQVEGAAWNLVNRSTGACATVSGSSVDDGIGLVQGRCDSSGAAFVLDPTGDGYLRLVGDRSGKAVGGVNCAANAGGQVTQNAWRADPCQQWTVERTSAGWSKVVDRATGQALEASACQTPGGPIVTRAASASACQEWTLQPVGPITVGSVATGKVFDIAQCSTSDGARLQQWEWLGNDCQRFTTTRGEDGYTELRPAVAQDKCLAVTGGSTADNAVVALGGCGVVGGSWRITPRSDGTVSFEAAHSGKVLDLSYCSPANGTAIGQYTNLSNDCQSFRLAAAGPVATAQAAVTASAAARCVAGNVVIAVTARNTGSITADLEIVSPWGTKSFPQTAAGATKSVAFSTRTARSDAAEVQAVATLADDIAARASTAVKVAAKNCR